MDGSCAVAAGEAGSGSHRSVGNAVHHNDRRDVSLARGPVLQH